VDNPIIGCAPGTGLAALAMLDLRHDPADGQRERATPLPSSR
jgi:hypothetical protein